MMEETPAAEASTIEGAPMPNRAPVVEQMMMAPPEAPEAMEVPTAGEAPSMEEMVVEVPLQGAATTGGEGVHVSPEPLEMEVTPRASAAHSTSQGAPRSSHGVPLRAAWTLAQTGGAPLGRLYCTDTIKAAHRCLDQLGASLEAEERRLDAERATLAKAWTRFHTAVEEKR
jgi:hypothetical protein